MSLTPNLEDLRLVCAVADHGSVAAAARVLLIAQPSASQRLGRLERRCGAVFFDRDTTGARPTPTGAELVRGAREILARLDGLVEAAATASEQRELRVGTFVSLAPGLFPALEESLGAPVAATVGHGPGLVGEVAGGTLDAAVVGVVEQMSMPRGVRAHPIGDDLVQVFRRRDLPGRGRGRYPFAGRRLLVATYDRSGPEVRARLTALGGHAVPAPTLPTAIAMARRLDCLAVLPGSALTGQLGADEMLERLPFRHPSRLWLVTGRDADPRLTVAARHLRRQLGLSPVAD